MICTAQEIICLLTKVAITILKGSSILSVLFILVPGAERLHAVRIRCYVCVLLGVIFLNLC